MAQMTVETGGVHVRVPAKINLALAVGPMSDDGYHRLATVFQAVSLYDEVVAIWADAGEVSCSLTGEIIGVPADSSNLAVRAAELLRQRYGGPDRDELGVHLTIKKAIPVAGGMAGGSADAAGALLACAVLWDIDADPDDLRELGALLGSDVPFALTGMTAVGTDRGTHLAPALTRGTYHWVLATSDKGLSTPAVYQRFDELGLARTGLLEPDVALLTALASGDVEAVGAALSNDLQTAAISLRPSLGELLAAGKDAGALGAIVSGSGPTCAFLTRGENEAVDLSIALSHTNLATGIKRVAGPVPGARLLS